MLGPEVVLLPLQRQVIGQEEAVRSVASALKRARLGLKDPNRPIATLMFCGPTGVGKTQLTKVLVFLLLLQILRKRPKPCMQQVHAGLPDTC